MSLLQNHDKGAKRELFGAPMSVVVTLLAIVIYFGAVALIGFSTVRDHDGSGNAGQPLLSP